MPMPKPQIVGSMLLARILVSEWPPGQGCGKARAGVPSYRAPEKIRYEYEGKSHDVIDNKG
jgi:hypothetical protein